MTVRSRAGAAAAAILALGTLAAGCAPIRGHQGYLLDPQLVQGVQPGVDNRESVQATLGRPSFVGQFDQRDWYYVSRGTKQLAFARPSPSEQTVLHVRFDEAGNVVAVNRTGLELVQNISPTDRKTSTLGRERSFFEELFGNIGAVGAAGRNAGTPDNPQ